MSKSQQSSTAYVTLSVTVVLFLLGVCLLLFFHANRVGNLLKQEMDIVLEIENGVNSKSRSLIEQKLKGTEGVQVESVTFVSAKSSFESLKKEYLNGIDVLENPLLDMFVFNVEAAAYSESYLENLKTTLETWSGVSNLYYQNEETSKAKSILNKLGIVVLFISAFFSLVAILLIINTLRLRLYADRLEIKTMQTVGAKNSFIKKPYLHRSMGIGLRGSIYAVILLVLLIVLASFSINGVLSLISWPYVLLVLLILGVFAMTLLVFVTNTQLNKYLSASYGDIL